MIKVSNREGIERIEYDGFCSDVNEFVEIAGMRTWKLLTGRNIMFAHSNIRCSHCHMCYNSGKCTLVAKARRIWSVDAQIDSEDALDEMLSWC